MRRVKGLALAALLLAAAPAAADTDDRSGSWFVTARADRFSEGNNYVARVLYDPHFIISVRCMNKRLDIAVQPQLNYSYVTTGDVFSFKFRVDRKTIFQMFGEAKGNAIFIDDGEPKLRQLVNEMRDGRELAMRIGSTTTDERIFPIEGAARAFKDIVRECPLD